MQVKKDRIMYITAKLIKETYKQTKEKGEIANMKSR